MDKQIQIQKLQTFKALILDGDGVWFTGFESRAVSSNGDVILMKSRHHHDGQGVSFMRALGIKILFATAEGEPMGSVAEKLNRLPSVRNGAWEPVSVLSDLKEQGTKEYAIEKWLAEQNLSWEDCAYIGDDRTDFECMQKAGLTATPVDGQRLIQKIAHIVLSKEGGRGAIREFSEMVLDARGIDETTLPAA